jgi:hypothetical protein
MSTNLNSSDDRYAIRPAEESGAGETTSSSNMPIRVFHCLKRFLSALCGLAITLVILGYFALKIFVSLAGPFSPKLGDVTSTPAVVRPRVSAMLYSSPWVKRDDFQAFLKLETKLEPDLNLILTLKYIGNEILSQPRVVVTVTTNHGKRSESREFQSWSPGETHSISLPWRRAESGSYSWLLSAKARSDAFDVLADEITVPEPASN